MPVKVIGSLFQGPGQPGDFTWMVEQPTYAQAFFIFNDNETQFRAFHEAHPGALPVGACSPGAGNGAMRPWQCASPPRAGGIPTGDHGAGYAALTPKVETVIDRAVGAIAQTVATYGYKEIYYSSDSAGGLGAATFSPAEDVKAYIVEQIARLAQD